MQINALKEKERDIEGEQIICFKNQYVDIEINVKGKTKRDK